MNRHKAWLWPLCAVAILGLFLVPARSWAQDDSGTQANDPPARVARINYAQGSVSFQPGGEGDWVDAVPNRPLTTGDNLWADQNSRAELHAGSTSIRISSETSLTFLQLDDQVLQLRLAQGSVLVRVRHLDDDDTVEIDTPNLAFVAQSIGEYRVDADPDGKTTIVEVYGGRGEAIGGGNNYTILANQRASFSGDQDEQLTYDIDTLSAADDFTNWAFDRDRREDRSQSANYVSPEMTGYEDLDDNGSWSYDGNYGPVWVPANIPMGWAPYRFGHWVWIAPWGWTWVDDAPWGFAPFHYGRWAVVRGRWGWIPGPVRVRPVFAPALVAFVGGGGFHFSGAAGGGVGVAWFPLGPGEVFVPAYHVSRVYVNRVNVTNTVVNVTKVTNDYNTYTSKNTAVNRITYVNQASVTAVSRETFVNARPVARNVVVVQPREVAEAPISQLSGAEPMRGSVMGAGKPTTYAPPRAVINRQVVALHAPAQPPMPFAQRQDKLLVRTATPAANRETRPVSQPATGSEEAKWPEPDFKTKTPAPAAPQTENQAPRPAAQPQPAIAQPARAPESSNREEENPEPSVWSHPQARPAPPVQPKSEAQARDEETKHRNWEAKPQPARAQPERAAPPSAPTKK
ncbi:MAG: DUF6600 domain-containing protein [Terriglobales bacterium]